MMTDAIIFLKTIYPTWRKEDVRDGQVSLALGPHLSKNG